VAASSLETLCSAKCDIAEMLTTTTCRQSPFHEAAVAAGHPLPLQLGALHEMLLHCSYERKELLSFITKAQTSCTVIDEIRFIYFLELIRMSCKFRYPMRENFQAELCVEALSVVSKKRSQYEARRGVFRKKIEQLLEEYALHHFWVDI
jgi:hypothetical protein